MAADLILTGRNGAHREPRAAACGGTGRSGTAGCWRSARSRMSWLTGTITRTVRDLAGAAVVPRLRRRAQPPCGRRGDRPVRALVRCRARGGRDPRPRARGELRLCPRTAWITGGSWASTLMSELNSSAVRERLDEAAGGRPVMLSRRQPSQPVGEHAGLASGRHHERRHSRGRRGRWSIPRTESPAASCSKRRGMLVAQARTASGRPDGGAAPTGRRAAASSCWSTFGVTAFQDAAVFAARRSAR